LVWEERRPSGRRGYSPQKPLLWVLNAGARCCWKGGQGMGTAPYRYSSQVSDAWNILTSRVSLARPQLSYKDLDSLLSAPVGARNIGRLVLDPIQNYCLVVGLPDLTVLVRRSLGKGRTGQPGNDFFCNGFGIGYGRTRCGHQGHVGASGPCVATGNVPTKSTLSAGVLASVCTATYPPAIPISYAASLPRRHACP
jgi:hypothetical protein